MTSGIEQPVRTAPAVAALDVLAAATARRVRDLGVALAAFWVIVIAVAGPLGGHKPVASDSGQRGSDQAAGGPKP